MLVEDPVFSGDIQEYSNSEVQKHPDFGELRRVVSSIKHQVSTATSGRSAIGNLEVNVKDLAR
jgi:hypothetical protein